MHIPDGFLDIKTASVTGALAVVGLGVALRQGSREISPRRIPLLGLSAAFVFAAQMINFPVAYGTSGHLMGAALVTSLLGPAAAIIVISTVLIVQCFMFGDGGITALGANIFNMAIVGATVSSLVDQLLRPMLRGNVGRIVAASMAGYLSVVLASVACSAELAGSGIVRWNVVLPAMTGIHMLIGIGEAIITAITLSAILSTRPELVNRDDSLPASWRYASTLIFGLLIAIAIVVFVSPFASSSPDGLDATAQQQNFEHHASEAMLHTPIADYKFPGISSESLATSVAGAIGTMVVFVMALVIAKIMSPRRSTVPSNPAGGAS